MEFEEERLKIMTNTIDEQIRVQEEQVSRLKSITSFQHGLKASMVVRAGTHGVLSEIPLQIGQYAQAGATLAKVVPTPLRLKAVLRIPETQAKDLAIGQKASIDTRNGILPGHVSRIDPASTLGTVTVDVALDGTPAGQRPAGPERGRGHRDRPDEERAVHRPARPMVRPTRRSESSSWSKTGTTPSRSRCGWGGPR